MCYSPGYFVSSTVNQQLLTYDYKHSSHIKHTYTTHCTTLKIPGKITLQNQHKNVRLYNVNIGQVARNWSKMKLCAVAL